MLNQKGLISSLDFNLEYNPIVHTLKGSHLLD